jgi:hypothetical protein
MNEQKNLSLGTDEPENRERRELVQKLGKFAIYAAPFTVLVLKGNAQAAGGSGHGHLGGSATPSQRSR